MTQNNIKAVLLIGPTGSGKTPFGDLCQEKGLNGTPCFHFDFGESLRQVAKGEKYRSLLTNDDVTFVKKVLREGALLENETFYIAENILKSFILENNVQDEDILMLNGLPRHKDQADDVLQIVAIESVICLTCEEEVITRRIKLNTGGDRSEREDDSLEEIKKKLDIFRERTIPLVDYFRSKHTVIQTYAVGIHTSSDDLYQLISETTGKPS